MDEQQAAALRARALAEVERRNDPTYRGGRDVVVGACPRCGTAVRWSGRGRKPRWCSASCRQRVKEARRVAREAEQPLSVIEAPAGPHNAQAWVARLIDPTHWQLLAAVLGGLAAQIDAGWRHGLPPEARRVAAEVLGIPVEAIEALRAGRSAPRPPGDAGRAGAAKDMDVGAVQRFIDTLAEQISTGGPEARQEDYTRVLLAAQRMVDAHDRHRRHSGPGPAATPPAPAAVAGGNRAPRRAGAKHRH